MSVVAVLVANAVLLVGLYAFGWSPGTVAFLFWFEAAVVGVVTLAKVAASLPGDVPGTGTHVVYERPPRPGWRASARSSVPRVRPVAAIPLFLVLYGLVLGGYGTLLLGSLGERNLGRFLHRVTAEQGVWLGMAFIVLERLWAFWTGYVRGPAWQRRDPTFHFWRPFGLVFVAWFGFFVGFFLLGWVESKLVVLTVLVLAKAVGESFNALLEAQSGEWQRVAPHG